MTLGHKLNILVKSIKVLFELKNIGIKIGVENLFTCKIFCL